MMKGGLVSWLLYERWRLCQNRRVGKNSAKGNKRSFIGLQVYITSTCEQPRSRRWHKASRVATPHTVLPERGGAAPAP
jgi:hypothetical protein